VKTGRRKDRKTGRFLLLALSMLFACRREERPLNVPPPNANRIYAVRLPTVQPGVVLADTHATNAYEENAYALNQGKTLFSQYNCVGCHSHGGGGMGPPLMDSTWIYGSAPEQVFATIVEGRPNGMPSFRGRIPDFQVWQLVAYVRSMSGLVPFTAATGRADRLYPGEPENSHEHPPAPRNTTPPKSP
jgi:cytochrome c oxidase cbb3-type subunit 3